MKKIICTICARGGSKGVPNKNIRIIGGKPLIVHSILKAQESNIFSGIFVSTDSMEIKKVAQEAGATIIDRPIELATDTAAKIPAIQHALKSAEQLMGSRVDIIVDLDATSPLRNKDDILNCIKMLENTDLYDNIITGMPARRSPYFNLVEQSESGQIFLSKKFDGGKVVRRQDSPKCFDMNASIYVWKRESLLSDKSLINERTGLYVMPEDRSIDIDSELDFQIVNFIMENKK